MTLSSLPTFARTALVAAGALLALPGGASATPTDAALLDAIRAQAPNTVALTDVTAAPDQPRVAIRTRAQADGDPTAHDELWAANADGSAVTPLRRSTGSAAAFTAIEPVTWSADGAALTYVSSNSAVKLSSAAHVVTFRAGSAPLDASLGNLTSAPQFTADGRYVTFVQAESPLTQATGAYDLASGALLAPARVDYVAPDGAPTRAPWVAPQCARTTDANWQPAQTTGRWIEQALASPDPGCRFGANANDPGPRIPDPQHAEDAPASITRRVPGTNLVTISDRAAINGRAAQPGAARVVSVATDLRRATRRGLRVRLQARGARRVQAYVLVTRPAGEGIFASTHSSRTTFTLGRRTIKRPGSRTRTVAIPLTRVACKALTRLANVTVTVRLVATDAHGHRTVTERPVALTRR